MQGQEKWLLALGLTESDGDVNAPNGDDGCAIGRFQTHIDWLWAHARKYVITPSVGVTLDEFQESVIGAFYRDPEFQELTDLQKAMTFHKGHVTTEAHGGWDADYADRFAARLASLP